MYVLAWCAVLVALIQGVAAVFPCNTGGFIETCIADNSGSGIFLWPMAGSSLSGTLPPSVGGHTQHLLVSMDMSNNQVSGFIPSQVCRTCS